MLDLEKFLLAVTYTFPSAFQPRSAISALSQQLLSLFFSPVTVNFDLSWHRWCQD